MVVKKLMKSTWYPRPHNSDMIWGHGIETAVVNHTTICPLVMYDEGKGSPSGYSANPENPSFAETDEPNCYPESTIDKITCFLEFAMTKGALETDKIHAMKVAFMLISTSFEDLDAKDEKSGETIGTILEMTSEATDRQAYPLWNTVDMSTRITGLNILPAAVPALTATQAIEGVAFSIETYYDALQYYTIANKLRNVQSGLKWVMLTRQRPVRRFKINISGKNKFMNQFNFFGAMVSIPKIDTVHQIPTSAETTDITHVAVRMTTRYQEWN